MALVDKYKLRYDAAAVFSPGAPIDRYDLFAGRQEQAFKLIDAIPQRGQHVVLYGERGVGKTSMVNVLSEILSRRGIQSIIPAAINCDAQDTFDSIWEKIFRQIRITETKDGAGFVPEKITESQSLFSKLPKWLDKKPSEDGQLHLTPEDIRFTFQVFRDSATVIVIDEFDRVNNDEAKRLISDTIKTLSDHSVRTTLIIVGVADSVDVLLREHRSVERSLVQVKMPRMSKTEIEQLLDKGFQAIDLQVDEDAINKIVEIASGLPHYAHLLGLHAAQAAIDRERSKVSIAEVNTAINLALDNAQQGIMTLYEDATYSPRPDALYESVLLACALAPTDDLGFFSSSDVRGPLSELRQRRYETNAFSQHLNDFSNERGPILQQKGKPRKYRYRFTNPLMQPYVIMKGHAAGALTNWTLFDESEPLA